jgi:hypothetical protein
MKKLVFGFVATGFIMLSSFTVVDTSKSKEEVNTVSCRWRTVVYSGGVAHYSEWTYGNCNRSESGRLTPIR